MPPKRRDLDGKTYFLRGEYRDKGAATRYTLKDVHIEANLVWLEPVGGGAPIAVNLEYFQTEYNRVTGR